MTAQPDIRAVFFDIDRTLYEHSTDHIPASSLAAIHTLREKGIIPAIATGRGACALPPALAEVVARGEIELIISANGQLNLYKNEILTAHPLPKADLMSLIAAFKARDWEFTFISRDHMAAGRSRGSAHSIIRNYPCYKIEPDHHEKEPIYQIVVLTPIAEEKALQAILKDHGGRYKTIRSHSRAVDLLFSEGSKARGILEACAKLGIDPAQTAAFGDGLNDIEMLETVGVGVAMGDACAELKAVADRITGTLEEDGIATALAEMGLI